MTPLLLAAHALAAVLWVGGMAFAWGIARPSLGHLQGPDRLRFWGGAFSRFFPLVWGCVAVLIVSGYGMIFGTFGGFAGSGMHVHVMQLLGWIMFAIFGHLYFGPWRRFRQALESDPKAAAIQLDSIRRIVAINLVLGLVVVAIGSSGRYWAG